MPSPPAPLPEGEGRHLPYPLPLSQRERETGPFHHPPSMSRAPNGRRVVLRPVIAEGWIPRTSRGGLAVAVVLCATWFLTGANRLNHTDLWGHLSFGRWIVEHRALPQSDPFRSFAEASCFSTYPWLSQVVGYVWYRALGAEGLVLAHALLMTLTAGGLVLAVLGRGVSAAWAAAAAATAYLLCLPIVGTMRPQVFGMVAFVATLWAITQLPRRRHPLVWLPMAVCACGPICTDRSHGTGGAGRVRGGKHLRFMAAASRQTGRGQSGSSPPLRGHGSRCC